MMSPVQFSYDPDTLPRVFRAEDKWPGLIGGARDQVCITLRITTRSSRACRISSNLIFHRNSPSGLVWRLLGSVCCVSVGGQSQHWPRSDKRDWNNIKMLD